MDGSESGVYETVDKDKKTKAEAVTTVVYMPMLRKLARLGVKVLQKYMLTAYSQGKRWLYIPVMSAF